MSDTIGRGVIEITADATKLKAGIDDAKKSIGTLGTANKDASEKSSASIDKYIKSLQTQQVTLGKTRLETELYKLSLRGASDEQLRAAESTIRLSDAYKKGGEIGATLKTGLIAGAGLLIAAGVGIAATIKSSIDAADHLNDLSKQTGIAVETLGGLGFAASQAGGDLDTIVTAAGKLNRSIAEAARGNKEYAGAFSSLGINIRAANGDLKTADVVLAELADKFATYSDGPNKAALQTKLLGTASASLTGLLNDGGKALLDNVEYYKKYAGVTQDTADKSDQFNDTLGKIGLISGGLGRQLTANLLPSLNSVADELLRSKENGTGLAEILRGISDEVNKLIPDLIEGAKAAGGFADAILIGGTVNPFRSLESNIKAYKEEIASTQADIERFKKNGSDTSSLEQALDTITKRLALVEGQAYRAALAVAKVGVPATSNDILDSLVARVPKDKKPDAPALPTRGGGGRAPRNTAAQEAKAQLALDLDSIRKASDATIGAYSNGERVLESLRSANLVTEQDYYRSKLGFLNLNTEAQEKALQAEIARLQQEKLTGKEKIDNTRQILDLEAKLVKVRENADAAGLINGIQQKAALDKVKAGYDEAATAADNYIRSVQRQYKQETDGIGRGTKSREEQAGRNQIDNRFLAEKDRLQAKRDSGPDTQDAREAYEKYLAIAENAYSREVDAYDARTARINKSRESAVTGAAEALQNYYDNARDVSKSVNEVVTSSFQGLEDSLVSFTMTGKLSFKSLEATILSGISRIIIKQQISNALGVAGSGGGASIIGSIIGAFTGTEGVATAASKMPGDALDNFLKLSGQRATGGPVAAGGRYLVGEKGPEILNMGSASGNIIPNNLIGSGNAGGQTITVNTYQTFAAGTDRATVQQAAAATGLTVRRALARNG